MTVHLYTIAWNEGRILPFFFRHYDRYVDRYIIYDDGSDDDTLEILGRHPGVEVRPLERPKASSYLEIATSLRNTMWKESRGQADWVIAADIDEHLYHPDIERYLRRCQEDGVTLIPALGFQMVTDAFPRSDALLCEEHTRGAPYRPMNKLGIFNPDAIQETNFIPGRHRAKPTGLVRYPRRDELLNLHYKFLGVEFTQARHSTLLAKLSTQALDDWARPGWSLKTDRLREKIEMWKRAAVDISDPPQRLRAPHRDPEYPWWWQVPPWWRLRWWHLQWWWNLFPRQAKEVIKAAIRALRLWKN